MSTTFNFTKLGEEIAVARAEVGQSILDRTIAKQTMAEREFVIMSGVEYSTLGKNEGERVLAKERLLREDAAWSSANIKAQAAELNLIGADLHLEYLREVRRGMEWDVRARLVVVSGGMTDGPAGSDEEVDELAFVDATQGRR